jgi:hypothetical protein
MRERGRAAEVEADEFAWNQEPMNLATRSSTFVRAYRDWINANCPYGMGAMLSKSCPDLTSKARAASLIAEANYWQMPFEKARVKFPGLPERKWREKREADGLPPV